MKNNKYIIRIRQFGQTITSSAFVKFLKDHKKALAITVITIFLAVFGYYIYKNPAILKQVFNIGWQRVILLLILYAGFVLTNVGITQATIRLNRRNLPLKETTFLTIYSSVINFFGPLQSGPGIRAIYLKSKIGLRIRDFIYTMMFYYAAYGALNVSLLFINRLPWLCLLGTITSIALVTLGTKLLGFRALKKQVFYIFILTAIQIAIMICVYSIELNAVAPTAGYSLAQTTVYTASANLAMFVSLTPGAIGFREAFLVLSKSLHNISMNSIVAAGVTDRAIYVIFLLILFVLSSVLNLKSILIRKEKVKP